MGYIRVLEVLANWRGAVGRANLQAGGLPAIAAEPFQVTKHDVADVGRGKTAVWSKIFPFLLLIWALTGAFYPAIDLCAGEKERGTLETLLSSPAARVEIVGGKLCTVMLFSAATAVLELAEHGHHRILCARPAPAYRSAAADGDGLAVGGAAAGFGAVQRLVPGAGGVRPQHERRAVLLDAAVVGHDAAGGDRRSRPALS